MNEQKLRMRFPEKRGIVEAARINSPLASVARTLSTFGNMNHRSARITEFELMCRRYGIDPAQYRTTNWNKIGGMAKVKTSKTTKAADVSRWLDMHVEM